MRKHCCENIVSQDFSWVYKQAGNNVSLPGNPRNISLETNVSHALFRKYSPRDPGI